MSRSSSLIAVSLTVFASVNLTACSVKESPGQQYYYEALRLEHDGGTTDDVLNCLNKAIDAAPASHTYRTTRALLFFDTGNYSAALKDYDAAVNSAPTHSYTIYMRGLTLAKLRQIPEARKDFEHAIAISPSGDSYYNALALCQLHANQLPEALQSIEKAIRIAPRYMRWHYMKAFILSRMGKEAEARAEFAQTTVFSHMLSCNRQEHVYFDGNLECERAARMTLGQMDSFWHYGGRWMPAGVEAHYHD